MDTKEIKSGDDFLTQMAKDIEESQQAQVQSEEAVEAPQVEEATAPEEVPQEVEDGSKENEVQDSEQSEEAQVEPSNEGEEGVIEDWAGSDDVPDAEESSKVDYSALAKELGVTGEGKDAIIDAFKTLSTELAEVKSNPVEVVVPEGLPAEISDVVEAGYNVKDYMAIKDANYDSYSNLELVGESVAPYFKDAEGNFDQDGYNDYIDGLSDDVIRVEGSKIRNQLKAQQDATVSQIQQIAEQRKAEDTRRLKQAVESFTDVEGFKVSPKQRDMLHKDIESGKAIKELTRGEDGRVDYSKLAKAYFVSKYFDKMLGFYKQRASTSTKRDMLSSISNDDVSNKGTSPNPNVNVADPMDLWMNSLMQQK